MKNTENATMQEGKGRTMKKILLISGSTRRGGFNEQLAHAIAELIGSRAEVSMLDWYDVPLYVQTTEYPAPPEVERVRAEVATADALWFVTPEYNHQIPGALKNLTDWLSRSLDPSNPKGESAIHGKIATVSSSAGDGGTHVRPLLEDLLAFIRTRLVRENGTGVAISPHSWETGALEMSEEDIQALSLQVDSLLNAVKS